MKSPSELFNSILFTESPWLSEYNWHEEKYKKLLPEVQDIVPIFSDTHKLDFPNPINSRTRYYNKFITGARIEFLNQLADKVSKANSESTKKYEVNSALKEMYALLKICNGKIIERQYKFEYITNENPSSVNSNLKGESYIMLLLESTLVFLILSIQDIHIQYVIEENYTYNSIYTVFLSVSIPVNYEIVTPLVQKNESQVVAKPKKKDLSEMNGIAENHLRFLKGNNIHRTKIMRDEDYQRLLDYTYYLIENEKVPTGVKQIGQLNLPTGCIKYTYYLIHKELYTTHAIKKVWIDFLKSIFFEFKDTEWQTIKTKFSEKPRLFDSDMKKMLG